VGQPLPDPLPTDPLPLVESWLTEAAKVAKTATAMTLATVTAEGRAAARMVICRGFDVRAGWLVFYTDRESDKGRDLTVHPQAALVFHWEALERQVRVDGPVTLAPDSDSDRYWATRPRDARVAAAASLQSQPLASRADLVARVTQTAQGHGDDVPRPSRWGGYRVWAERVEMWAGQPARVHDRARWTRTLTAADGGWAGGPWRATRLMP
jgi:pyridoxamine 5'-phosphate oxidase